MKQKLLLILLVTFLRAVQAQEITHVDFDTNNANIVFNSWNTSSTFAKGMQIRLQTLQTASAFVGQFTAGNDNGIGIGVVDRSYCIYNSL